VLVAGVGSVRDDSALEAVTIGEISAEDDNDVLVADIELVEEVTLSAPDDSVLNETSLVVGSVAEALGENGVGTGVADTEDES